MGDSDSFLDVIWEAVVWCVGWKSFLFILIIGLAIWYFTS